MRTNYTSRKTLRRYNVNRREQEVVRQSLYDIQTYTGSTGHTSLTFFAVPQGQSSKTEADTNMEVAGSLPAPKSFLIESVQILFFPSDSPGSIKTTLAKTDFANDVYAVGKTGYLDLFIGSKSYLTEGPLMRFPAVNGLKVSAAYAIERRQASAADAADQVSMDYATFTGRPYRLDPPVRLIPNQNFKVTLNWPAAIVLPSGNDARIGVILDGVLYRNSQ